MPYGNPILKYTYRFLKVTWTNSLATVVACALYSCLESVLKVGACRLCKVTSGHHVVLLDKLLDLGSDDVGHGDRGNEVDGEIVALPNASASQ